MRRINLTEQLSDPSSDYSFSFGDYIFMKASLQYHEENGIGHKKRLLKQKKNQARTRGVKEAKSKRLVKTKKTRFTSFGLKRQLLHLFLLSKSSFFLLL